MARACCGYLLFVFLVSASSTPAQQPHWYVLLEPGNERWYHCWNGYGFHETVTGYQEGSSVVEVEMYYGGYLSGSWQELWRIDAEGDVSQGENCYIDMPLELGKSWGRTWGQWNQYYDRFTIVDLDDDTIAPNCLVIREEVYEGGTSGYITTRWYSDGAGLVFYSTNCGMCMCSLEPVVVSTERTTWGHVKSRYDVGSPAR